MKILIVGGGIGGYVCALRAAQLGANVTLAEKKRIGGTCLNEGCIPTKSLLESAQLLDAARQAKDLGVVVEGEPRADFSRMQARKQEVVDQLVHGIGLLLEKGSIEVITADVRLTGATTARINEEEKSYDAVVLATGSVPTVLPIDGMDLEGVIDSTGALALEEIPASMAIVGGGVIGTEFASLFSSLGTKVTVIEMMERIVPPMDPDISEMLRMTLEHRGIQIHTGAKVQHIQNDDGLKVVFEQNGNVQEVHAEKVLVATGRSPVTDAVDPIRSALQMDRVFVRVDANMQTNLKGLYAIGDVTGKSMLAHTAEEMGVRAAERIMGKKTRPIDYEKIPACLYTHPEAASCGYTEPRAQERGYTVQTGIFPLFNNARTLIAGQADNTFVKVVADKETGELLGVHLFGPYATELIAEAALAMELECTVQELIDTIHPHPTVSEGLKEGAAAVLGTAIHAL